MYKVGDPESTQALEIPHIFLLQKKKRDLPEVKRRVKCTLR